MVVLGEVDYAISTNQIIKVLPTHLSFKLVFVVALPREGEGFLFELFELDKFLRVYDFPHIAC